MVGKYRRVPVAIVGGGPVGLSLALGLTRAGVRSLLVDREESTSSTSRAPGVHVRTREVLRQWGVEDEFLARGDLQTAITLHRTGSRRAPLYTLDFRPLAEEADSPGLLLLEQSRIESLLLDSVRSEALCQVNFGTEAIGLEARPEGVRLTVREGDDVRTIQADYVVGCDGAGSFVREAIGMPFDGDTYSLRPVLADVRMAGPADDLPWPRAWNGRRGFSFAARLPGGLWRLVAIRRDEPEREEVDDEEVAALAERLLGARPTEVEWSSRFRIHLRSAPRFRLGRVLLAGDAAHIHSPAMGFGMNAGIQDAHNLAWKLARVVRGADPEPLLDSYDVERRAVVVETVSRVTDRVTRLFLDAPAAARAAAFFLIRQAMRVPPVRTSNLRRLAMLDLAFPESPILRSNWRAAGVRLPDPLVVTPSDERIRLHRLVGAGPALLVIGDSVEISEAEREGVQAIRFAAGEHLDPGGSLKELLRSESGLILVRPDLHVAWARSDGGDVSGDIRHALGDHPVPGAAAQRVSA